MYSSIDCTEMYGQHQHTISNDASSATVDLMVAWANRYALVADIVGGKRPFPYMVDLLAKSAAIKPHGDNLGQEFLSPQLATYDNAIVTVNYSTKDEEEKDGEDLVSESLEPTAEFRKEDYRRFRWESLAGDPLEESEAPGKLVHGLKLMRTLYRRASIPASALTLGGHVNSSPYTSSLLGLTFPAETLLFIPPKPSRTIKTDGTKAWTLQVAFEFKKDGWNKYWRAKDQEFQEILDTESMAVYKSYPTASFGDWLF